MKHELKTWPEFYKLIAAGIKLFELRRNDRVFQVGDTLHLREWSKDKGYTGRASHWQIKYILQECDGLKPGYCILGIYGPWGGKD